MLGQAQGWGCSAGLQLLQALAPANSNRASDASLIYRRRSNVHTGDAQPWFADATIWTLWQALWRMNANSMTRWMQHQHL